MGSFEYLWLFSYCLFIGIIIVSLCLFLSVYLLVLCLHRLVSSFFEGVGFCCVCLFDFICLSLYVISREGIVHVLISFTYPFVDYYYYQLVTTTLSTNTATTKMDTMSAFTTNY